MSKNVVFNLEVDTNLNEVDKSIEEIINSTEELEKKFETLRKAAAKSTDPAVFQKYAEAAGSIKDRIDDTNRVINQFASDTQKLDLAVETVQGLAGAFTLVQGTSALFGEENEELNKTLLKVQASMAVLNGLQQVANTLNKDSVVGTKLYAAANAILNSSFLTVNKGLRAFRIALISTGILAGVVAVGMLIANFDKLRDTVLKLFPGLEKLGKFFGRIFTAITDYIGITSEAERAIESFIKAQDKKIANTQREIRDLQQLGASERQLYEARNRLIDEEIAKLEKAAETKKGLSDEESQRLNELLQQRRELENNFFVSRQNAEKKNEENRIRLIRDEFQRRLAEIRLQRKKELEEAERLGIDKQLIIRKYAQQESDLIALETARIADREFSAEQKLRRLKNENFQADLKNIEKEYDEKLKLADGNENLKNILLESRQLEINEVLRKSQEELKDFEKLNFDEKEKFIRDYFAEVNKIIDESDISEKEKKRLKIENDRLQLSLSQRLGFEKQFEKTRTNNRKAEVDIIIKEEQEFIKAIRRIEADQTLNEQQKADKRLEVQREFNQKRQETEDIFRREFIRSEISYLENYNLLLNQNRDENLEAIIVNNRKILELNNELINEIDRNEEEAFNRRRNRILDTNRTIVDSFTGLFDLLDGLNIAYENGEDKTEAQREARAKKAFERNKSLQIAQTLISTYGGAVQAYQSQLIPGDPTSPIRGAIAAAAAVASGLGRVAAIRSTKFNSVGGGGSNPTSPSGGVPNPFSGNQQAPILPEVMQGKRADEDMRVFVLESDIRNTGRRVDVIEGRARGRF
jgi:hypothetical protein